MNPHHRKIRDITRRIDAKASNKGMGSSFPTKFDQANAITLTNIFVIALNAILSFNKLNMQSTAKDPCNKISEALR